MFVVIVVDEGRSALVSAVGSSAEVGDFIADGFVIGAFRLGRPDIIGGGRSNPSAALRVSCRAKSEACHHSRNLRAKMEVGRRILRLERRRGNMVVIKIRGWKILLD